MNNNNMTIFCLVDGEANAFSVEIDPTKPVDALKKLIKAAVTPRFDDIASNKLTLWKVSIPIVRKNKPKISLVNVPEKEVLDEADYIAGVFAETPPERTILIMVQRPPTDRASETEFVQIVVRDVDGRAQRPRSRSDTCRGYALSPTSYRGEVDIQAIFRVDVGSVKILPPFAVTLSVFDLQHGTPDLVCSRHDESSALFPIELKRPIELHLDDTDFPAAFLAPQSSTQSPIGPLRQIFGYMKLNGFRYGVLSTYRQTWFFKRVSRDSNDILVSPIIQFDRTEPTLLQCYLWLIRTADSDTEWQPDIPDEATVEAMLVQEQPEDRDAKRDSDLDPGHRGKLKQVKTFFTRSCTKGQQTKTRHLERLTIPAFKNLKPITYGEGARTFHATWMNEEVVVKKADVWNQHFIVSELEHEVAVYEALRTLQGRYVPKLKLAGVVDGMEMVLVTELVGTDLHGGQLNASDRDMIREALSAIHDLGVLHGDIRLENITRRREGHTLAFFFIDFGHSQLSRSKMALKGEREELEALLDMMPWPEGRNG
ncbi:hypothetical protein DFQ27_004402 [Actinomortierella ambigua]|uniref:Crinkler effector protein N-terminal domain-containing protein n=1 Tax=Actinomortierella ambigua TaxID=1343610 RepID=A0A9P6Q230_9FUNG|nr:hypothetical protein DFQ27_004402 [Actinomortierella ambigua]